MQGDPVPGTAGRVAGRRRRPERPPWIVRFWRELASVAPRQDPVVRLIVVERLVKSTLLVVVAVTLLAADRLGYLPGLIDWLQDQLDLAVANSLISRAVAWVVTSLGHLLPHVTVLAIGAILYALLEGTEGVGLALRRRWAEYLTVLATAVFIPYELLEVLRRATALRVGALALNVAIVVYLAYRKRLFVDV